MRAHGDLAGGDGIDVGGHVCWGFDAIASFEQATLEFLGDGQRLGERLAYVTCEPPELQRERLAPLGNIDRLLGQGALELHSAFDAYAPRTPSEAAARIGDYVAATARALADGYSGLRVAAQASELLLDPAAWERQLRWESAADRHMASQPMTALCGYDRQRIAPELLSDLQCVHPASRVGPVRAPFHIFHGDADTLVVCGEVDVFSVASFDRLLGVAFGKRGVSRLDLGELEFIDHHGLRTLADHRRRLAEQGRALSLVRMPRAARRLGALLEIEL
ncbi:MAG TPA: MEDS domain-containing protein [Solirubrobacteraceae bacterium]|nr:MEDS domain-containing protein [Solirubrobacteraceae bacterium]